MTVTFPFLLCSFWFFRNSHIPPWGSSWHHPPHVSNSLDVLKRCGLKPRTGCDRHLGSCHPPQSRLEQHHSEELYKPSWWINTTALQSARWKTTRKPGSPHIPASCCNSRRWEKQHTTRLSATVRSNPTFAPSTVIAPRTAAASVWYEPLIVWSLDSALLSGLHIFRTETNYQIRKQIHKLYCKEMAYEAMFERSIIYAAKLSTQKLRKARFMASCAIFMAWLLGRPASLGLEIFSSQTNLCPHTKVILTFLSNV